MAVGTVIFSCAGVSAVGNVLTSRKQDRAEWQVGDEVTLTLNVNWRCTYGAVERDVVSSTTKTSSVTVIEPIEPDVTWTEV